MVLLIWEGSVSPTVENRSDIILRSLQVSCLRNRQSESLVTYMICLVSRLCPGSVVPVNCRMMAPRILMPLLLTTCMHVVMGIRSASLNPRWQMILKLSRELWQPVSAFVCSSIDVSELVTGLYPKAP